MGGWSFETVARDVLSRQGLAKTKELGCMRAGKSRRDRESTPPSTATQSAATLRKWAADTPDEFRVLGQGQPLHGQPQKILPTAPNRSTRFLSGGITELGAEARADPVAARRDEEIRRRRDRGVLRQPAARARRGAVAARPGGSPPNLRHAGAGRDRAQAQDRDLPRDLGRLSADRRSYRRLLLPAPADDARHRDGLRGRPDRDLVVHAAATWPPGARPKDCR